MQSASCSPPLRWPRWSKASRAWAASQPGSATTLGLLAAGAVAAAAAVRHARRTTAPLLDLRALAVPTYALATATAGFVSRIAINASPFLLPLMFQIGFGMNAFQAGSMLLVYMGGNLVMKSATTAVLRRFGFRNVLTVNGAICAATLFGCGLLSPGDPLPWCACCSSWRAWRAR